MLRSPVLVAACLFAVVIGTEASRASALSCAPPSFVAPRLEAVDVPTNTLVWCSGPASDSSSVMRLRDARLNPVRGTQTIVSLPELDVLVFHPDVGLAANSVYHVDCPPIVDQTLAPVSFTTGAGPRARAPAVPNVSDMELFLEPDQSWGASYFARFLQASEPDSIVVFDLGGSAALDPEEPSGSVADATLLGSTINDVWVGTGPCGGNWREARLGASTTVALGAFDLTGAFSGWSDRVNVQLPKHYPTEESSGCQLGGLDPSSGSAASVLAVLACGMLRRRSRGKANASQRV